MGVTAQLAHQMLCNLTRHPDGVYQCLLHGSVFLSVPGPPVRLVFPEVRLTSVRIVWQPPEEPNGIILGKGAAMVKEIMACEK